MSWNKNTINDSRIDSIIKLLKSLDIKYKVTFIGEVDGMGLNDDNGFDEPATNYKLRRLEYKEMVILEQMVRHPDCDCDDVIISKEFKKSKVPKRWKIERKVKE